MSNSSGARCPSPACACLSSALSAERHLLPQPQPQPLPRDQASLLVSSRSQSRSCLPDPSLTSPSFAGGSLTSALRQTRELLPSGAARQLLGGGIARSNFNRHAIRHVRRFQVRAS